jgi:transposase
LAPEATACPCCRGPLVEIGIDASERLDVIPARFRVLVTKRPKLACRACSGVVLQAPAPARLVEGGMPTEATVAHVLVSRYADHLPLYRQAQILARQGIEIGREILADWTGTAAAEIVPVVRRLREILLASARLFADETTMPVLDPGRGQTKKGYAWAIARDDRPWGGADPPAAVFRYAPGRGKDHAAKLLGDYAGILQCDGYAAYKSVSASGGGITLAFCWAHTIRTQSCDGQAGAATGIGAWLGHWDDMLDLDVVVMHGDALDDELQDRLPLGDARSLPPSGNPRAEGREAFKRRERALALFLQAAQLGVLLLGQSALGSQRLAPLGKLWEADHLRLVSLDQAAIGTLDALDPLLDLALRRAGRVLDSAGFGCEAFELRQQPFGVAKQAGDVVPDNLIKRVGIDACPRAFRRTRAREWILARAPVVAPGPPLGRAGEDAAVNPKAAVAALQQAAQQVVGLLVLPKRQLGVAHHLRLRPIPGVLIHQPRHRDGDPLFARTRTAARPLPGAARRRSVALGHDILVPVDVGRACVNRIGDDVVHDRQRPQRSA